MPEENGLLSMLRRIFGNVVGAAPGDGGLPPANLPIENRRTEDQLARLLQDSRIPPKCRKQARGLADVITRIEDRAGSGGLGDPYLIELERIARVDLPELLDRYANIPEEHRAEIFRKTQKSASFHLGESLGVMERRVAEISRLLSQGPLDEFTDATKFVDSRYGHRDDPFA